MRELAAEKGDGKDEWGLAGLLHDIDIGTTANDLTRHGVVGAQILQDLGFSTAVVRAVKAHDDGPGIACTSRLDHALHCADQVYWLILATGLRFPSDELDAAVPKVIWGRCKKWPPREPFWSGCRKSARRSDSVRAAAPMPIPEDAESAGFFEGLFTVLSDEVSVTALDSSKTNRGWQVRTQEGNGLVRSRLIALVAPSGAEIELSRLQAPEVPPAKRMDWLHITKIIRER